MTTVADIEEKDGTYHIVGIHEEVGDRFKKFCLNPSCYTFGLISSEKIVDKFLIKNPEFVLKERRVVIDGNILDIVEINEEIAEIKRLADSGDHEAQFKLGKMYEEGENAGQSFDLAIKYYQMAKNYKLEAKERLKDLLKTYEIRKSTCPICMERFENITKDLFSTICGHSFHMTCLMEALENQSTCPVCRTELGFRCQTKEDGDYSDEEENAVLIDQNIIESKEAINALQSYFSLIAGAQDISNRLSTINRKLTQIKEDINNDNLVQARAFLVENLQLIDRVKHYALDHHISEATIIQGRSISNWMKIIEISTNNIVDFIHF